MKLDILDFELPLRHPFTISRESIDRQSTCIVCLEEDGQVGYGEATTNSYYGVSRERLHRDVRSVSGLLEATSLGELEPSDLWSQLADRLSGSPFALCAIDQAAHDLWGKLRGQPVHQLWGLRLANVPQSCFTIGIAPVEQMVAKMQEMSGWPIYKVKLGTDHDIEIVRELRNHTAAQLRVDANCGWSLDTALQNAEAFVDLGVEFIEQPLPADRWSDHRELFARSPLPIVADESCRIESDVDRCVGHFHGVNIKLVKCGGLTPARRMIDLAKRQGLKVMVGCMTESTVGISAIAQLLPLLDYVDMDGAALLAEDIATGATLQQGTCHFPAVNGCGVTLK